MTTQLEATVSARFGRPCALSADWAVDAWALGKGRYLIDNEGASSGELSIVTVSQDEDGLWRAESLLDLDEEQVLVLCSLDPAFAEERAAMLDDWAVRMGVDIT